VTNYRLREVVDGAFLVDPSGGTSTVSMGLYLEEVSSTLVELRKYDAEVEQKTLPAVIDFPLEYPLAEYGYELLDGDNRVVKAVRMMFEITIRFDGAAITPEDFSKSLTLEYHYGPADFDLLDSKIISSEVMFIEDDDL
jgi:hypothetical protein